ncbi:PREDICTED: kinesin-like protein KIN-12E [Nelumbo nucifera]|uniref:Kinesin-like protein KIN-12E n=2 Tax=Nelumbo nucifera TaxID=4432 RepID=A0A1U8AKJ7_NELNU|nr:PREDICTED: kinesin-like protein KIN-12E [Nelumbo nucifera]DAD29043.1 TPA_asm: hypothetical protein HUJ06_030511 [Nelumbo nucifera]
MPIISEAASAIRSRFRFQEHSECDSVRSTPNILKSASKENLCHSIVANSAIRSISGREEHSVNGAASQSFELEEDPSFWKDHNVQVVIRIRPLSSSEISLQGYSKCVRQESSQTVTWIGHPESRFTFDLVAGETISQEKLFKVAGVPMVENCMGGYNSCMFAYGQTGSGKTHTMLGDIEGGTRRPSVNCGMTPRVFEYLFSRIQKEKETRRDEKLRFTCKCSFLEIYNEQILDLLDPTSLNLQIREDAKKGIYVENLTELEVTSAQDVIQQLVQGAANRKVAATNMNRASSRSHSVFTCAIESKWESQGVTHHRFARLNLVDLAGSERQKSSGAEGERLKEATNINKSLSTLGLVIMNLVNISNGKSLHVPYRDSKLTFLLQDSLGGNSKTIIIANISPSNCCSLETLSTLKFAQRAKFIKNNAIVNEDASGDVIAMRLQIQQLKKEVSRLQGLVNGGSENQENNNWTVSFPGSPGCFKWEGLQGSFSPLTSDKRMSQKKEYEAALVGAFRREKDKDIALQALAAENQAAMQLAKQREDEIQGLKMRLRFREAGIKRLEAVASGKISAETHLLQEKEEHLKEIEVLRTQLDRNQEVTRFAMENLRLKEELRRLKSFVEEGEREMMSEQITILQSKLLEALDWKLMHEADLETVQKGTFDLATISNGEDNLLISSQNPTSWHSSMNEENEFLRMQAIQNQSELDALCKKLNSCLDEKGQLERRVNELKQELEDVKNTSGAMNGVTGQQVQIELPSLHFAAPDHMSNVTLNDQMELKTMVDAIASASQREAEAHETAIILAKENDELRMRLKILIDDNNKLIELYEHAAEEANKDNRKAGNTQVDTTDDHNCSSMGFPEERDTDRMREIEHLERQLQEMHEENEKLMGLYEKAMQERDELKRMLCFNRQNSDTEEIEEFNCPEKLVEVDGGEGLNLDELPSKSDDAKVSREQIGFSGLTEQYESGPCLENSLTDEGNPTEVLQVDIADNSEVEGRLSGVTDSKILDDLNLARMKLEKAENKLVHASNALGLFGLYDKATSEVDELSRKIEATEKIIQVKQQEIVNLSSEMLERRVVVDDKLLAMKSSLSSFSSSVGYWEQQEIQARADMDAFSSNINQKKEELARLQAQKDELEAKKIKLQKYDVELRNKRLLLKSKLEEEQQRQETEKVLLAIDNVEKKEITTQRNWCKATELLKLEEDQTKLLTEIKRSREELQSIQREIAIFQTKSGELECKIKSVEGEVQSGLRKVGEVELGLWNVIQEKQKLLEMDNGNTEVDKMLLEYHQSVFESDLKENEVKLKEEELQMQIQSLEELREARLKATHRKTQLLGDTTCCSCMSDEHESGCLSRKVEKELQDVRMSVIEVKSLLSDGR